MNIIEKKPTILVVDDEIINIEVMAGIFGDEYEVLAAKDGKEALDLVAQFHPDLILLDILMPNMDGFEVYLRLREDGLLDDTPVLFVTAMNSEEAEKRGLELGAYDYIIKPFKPGLVKLRVMNCLQLKFYRDTLAIRNKELQEACEALLREKERVRVLSGMLPICCGCKKIKDDQGYWQQLESFISEHSEAVFSHCYCPECGKILLESLADDDK